MAIINVGDQICSNKDGSVLCVALRDIMSGDVLSPDDFEWKTTKPFEGENFYDTLRSAIVEIADGSSDGSFLMNVNGGNRDFIFGIP